MEKDSLNDKLVKDYIKNIFEKRNESPSGGIPIGDMTRGFHIYDFISNFSVQHNLKREEIIRGIERINYAIEGYNTLRKLESMN